MIPAEEATEATALVGRATQLVAVVVTSLFVLSSCVVGDPDVTTARQLDEPAVTQPTVAAPVFEPTAVPAPTPTTAPPAPTPTTAASPTATPAPVGPAPLPTIVPAPDLEPTIVEAGEIRIPVGVTRFILDEPRPILQLSGHTLIYLTTDRLGEVDIFTPVATGDGTPLESFEDVVTYIQNDPAFATLSELPPVTIGGVATRVFEGTMTGSTRGFYTDLITLGNDSAGWFPPARTRMWVIDEPFGPIVVSAESLEDPGQYSEAVRLATEILATVTFS